MAIGDPLDELGRVFGSIVPNDGEVVDISSADHVFDSRCVELRVLNAQLTAQALVLVWASGRSVTYTIPAGISNIPQVEVIRGHFRQVTRSGTGTLTIHACYLAGQVLA